MTTPASQQIAKLVVLTRASVLDVVVVGGASDMMVVVDADAAATEEAHALAMAVRRLAPQLITRLCD